MLLIAFLVIGEFALLKTRFGQYLYAIGGNPEASRFSGLHVRTLTGLTYIFSGFTMGVAGLLAASQLSSAQAQMEPTIVFDVIAIVVLGGTSLAGGFGAIWRTAVGLAIIATISNGFTLLGLNPFYQSIVKGTVIILAVAFEGWARRLAAARLTKDIAIEQPASGSGARNPA
jgi:ribose transport system permease protein